MVLSVAPLKLNVGVGGQRGMAHAVLVHDDGRLINADHLSARRASKMQRHPRSFGPPKQGAQARNATERAVADYGRGKAKARATFGRFPRDVRGLLEHGPREQAARIREVFATEMSAG